VIFVTVDPERDTPEIIKDYVAYFDPRIVALTGELEAVRSMAKARYIHFEKLPGEDGNYDMQHTAGIQLVKADGAFAGTLDSHEPFKTRMAKLRHLIKAE
jgi:protein SCO1/2